MKFPRRSSHALLLQRRRIDRLCRHRVYRLAVRGWSGTRNGLRRSIRRTLHFFRGDLHALIRILRDARFAALIAGTVLTGSAAESFASPPIQLSAITAGNGGFVINGEAVGDESGVSVSAAGDVNGDGVADLIVGADGADPNGSSSGRSYVIFGKAGTASVELSAVAAGIGGFVINGEAASDLSGLCLSAAGDVNGDGFADLIVGARGADPHGSYSGRSYVIFGKAGTAAVELSAIASGIGGFAINGEAGFDHSGWSVSSAGDVNGDGLADLILGAPYSDVNGNVSGRSYVIFGKTGTAVVELTTIATGIGGFAINGEEAYDLSSFSVSGAGDVNGDGLSDLIVGAAYSNHHGASSGRSYVVFGKIGMAAVDLSAITAGMGGFVINGEAAGDYSGHISRAGDVNGDGLADLIVGAPGADPNGSYSGRSYVVFGKAGTAAVELSAIAAGMGGFAINGEGFVGLSGGSVSAAGDVNGDGLADLIVGSYQIGRSYLIFGKIGTTAVELSAIAAGTGGFAIEREAGTTGSVGSLSEAGDVNGDGLADVIVGAFGADPNGSYSGRSYVVFSPEIPPLIPPAGVPTSATYLARTRAGDGLGGAPAVPSLAPDDLNAARIKIDFSDDDGGSGGGLNGASIETVTLTRSAGGITNLNAFALPVVWHVTSDRVGFVSAEVTLKYLDFERLSAGVSENGLMVFTAPASSGPWTPHPTTVNAALNEVKTTVTGLSYFALGSQSLNAALHGELYE